MKFVLESIDRLEISRYIFHFSKGENISFMKKQIAIKIFSKYYYPDQILQNILFKSFDDFLENHIILKNIALIKNIDGDKLYIPLDISDNQI
ncbi:MAG: hypothetical protein WBA74_17205, partial [Cyclobacteriaceae bacterium]